MLKSIVCVGVSMPHSEQMVPFTDGVTGANANLQNYNLTLKSPFLKTVTTKRRTGPGTSVRAGKDRPGLSTSVRMGLAESSDLDIGD